MKKSKPLTKHQVQALAHIRNYHQGATGEKWVRRPAGFTAAEFGGLVRRGLLRSAQQSEQVRGEPRYFYALYQITDAGLAALAQAAPQ